MTPASPSPATINHAPFPDTGDESLRQFQAMVLRYYRACGRDLAWRRTTNPYRIVVSEIMLQQTQVERVSERYPRFIAAFPDFPSLAGAPVHQVLTEWQGMGYNRRALHLKECAARVVQDHAGKLPDDPDILVTLPGIGRATAASICAFAFNKPIVFIETNIRRVFIHYFFSSGTAVEDAQILPLVAKTLYHRSPRMWYNALMDLGTDLKKSVPNPNRKSRQYTKQAAFEGSDRQVRGAVLRLLLKKSPRQFGDLVHLTGGDTARIGRIIADLAKDGFLVQDHDTIRLKEPEERPLPGT